MNIIDLANRGIALSSDDKAPVEDGGQRRLKPYHNPFHRNVDPATGRLRPGARCFDPTQDTQREGDHEAHAAFYGQRLDDEWKAKEQERLTAEAAAAKRQRKRERNLQLKGKS